MGSKSNRSRRYSEEFKRDAVALVRSSGKTVTEVAREIGVSAEGLRNWDTPSQRKHRVSSITGKLHRAHEADPRLHRSQSRPDSEPFPSSL
ncbi:transposase [Streptomyces sp. NPDC058642]|uniref:transposase n=1 Tax=Streptomyces sp. NPDC058642 TaxID=3346572 RepID=UPI003660B914